MPEPKDQTEAELAKTRRVVAEHMAEQIAMNEASGREVAAAAEPEPDVVEPAPKAKKEKA